MIPESLTALLSALDASDTALQRDAVGGDYAIHGKTGHIYPAGTGYLIYVTIAEKTEELDRKPSARPWNMAKAKLAFCTVTQDGDWEGCLHLDRLPTKAEAAVIRDVLGIRKSRTMTAEALAGLEAARRSINRPVSAPSIAPFEQGATP